MTNAVVTSTGGTRMPTSGRSNPMHLRLGVAGLVTTVLVAGALLRGRRAEPWRSMNLSAVKSGIRRGMYGDERGWSAQATLWARAVSAGGVMGAPSGWLVPTYERIVVYTDGA